MFTVVLAVAHATVLNMCNGKDMKSPGMNRTRMHTRLGQAVWAKSPRGSKQRGFTYLAILAALTLLALSTNGVMTYVSQQAQREREDDLLRTGQVFVQAINDYYLASPGSVRKLPQQLEDLLDDKRQVSIRRYLREIYRDPTTNKADWDLVRGADGGVYGLRSRNDQGPIRTTPVSLLIETSSIDPMKGTQPVRTTITLPAAQHYSDWIFEFRPMTSQPGEEPPK
jgi:type II secretory pathway pseudopilin PulG